MLAHAEKYSDKLQHEMYWNIHAWNLSRNLFLINYNMRCIEITMHHRHAKSNSDKLQHEMYWNQSHVHIQRENIPDKLQHEMYWNNSFQNITFCSIWINYNMRCIEICKDVSEWIADYLINYNMRCIEILIFRLLCLCDASINYNMRCIEIGNWVVIDHGNGDKLQHEMYWNYLFPLFLYNLIPDKLQHEMYWNLRGRKHISGQAQINYNMRCIEIWFRLGHKNQTGKINYNMRCIEIFLKLRALVSSSDKLQHEMYWNRHLKPVKGAIAPINYNMRYI